MKRHLVVYLQILNGLGFPITRLGAAETIPEEKTGPEEKQDLKLPSSPPLLSRMEESGLPDPIEVTVPAGPLGLVLDGSEQEFVLVKEYVHYPPDTSLPATQDILRKAGIKPGCVLISLNNIDVREMNHDAVLQLLKKHKSESKKTWVCGLYRSGRTGAHFECVRSNVISTPSTFT